MTIIEIVRCFGYISILFGFLEEDIVDSPILWQ